MNVDELREAIASDNPGRARPALASLVNASPEDAEPLLLLGLKQDDMILRQLSCSGLGHKPTAAGWEPLVQTLKHDSEVAVRAEAANALVSHGLERAWPLLLESFKAESEWLIHCSILSAVVDHPDASSEQQLRISEMALMKTDPVVKVCGAEILNNILRTTVKTSQIYSLAKQALESLRHHEDYRIQAILLNSIEF